jgi:hypothetical protein
VPRGKPVRTMYGERCGITEVVAFITIMRLTKPVDVPPTRADVQSAERVASLQKSQTVTTGRSRIEAAVR